MTDLETLLAYAGEFGCETTVLSPGENGEISAVITPPIVGRGEDMSGDVHLLVTQQPDALRYLVSESYAGSILSPKPNTRNFWAWSAARVRGPLKELHYKAYWAWVKFTAYRGVAHTVDPADPVQDAWSKMRSRFDMAVWVLEEDLARGEAELLERAASGGLADG